MKYTLLLTFLFVALCVSSQETPTWITKFEESRAQLIDVENFSKDKLIAIKKYSKNYRLITIDKSNGDTTEILRLKGGYHFHTTQVEVDHSGNVIVAGTYRKEMSIEAYQRLSDNNVTKTFLLKFKPGQAIDTTNIKHFNALETTQLGILPGNEIVLSGFFRYKANIMGQALKAGLDDVFIMKLTPQLELDWIKNYGSGGDEHVTAMHIAQDGNIVISAKINRDFDLGEGHHIKLEKGVLHGAALWKMDPAGRIIWHHVFGAYSFGKVNIEAITANKNHLFLGIYSQRGCLFNQDTIHSMGRKDVLIAKIDQNGKNSALLSHIKSPHDVFIAGLGLHNNTLHLAGSFKKRVHIGHNRYYAAGDTNRLNHDIYYFTLDTNSLQHDFQAIGSDKYEDLQTLTVDDRHAYFTGDFDKEFSWGSFDLKKTKYTNGGFMAALPLAPLAGNPDPKEEPDPDDEPDNQKCPDPSRPTILSIDKYTNSLNVFWRKVDRADHYELIVSENVTMTKPVFKSMKIAPTEDPSFRIKKLQPDHSYYVRVFVEINCENKRAKSMTIAAKTKPVEDEEDPNDDQDQNEITIDCPTPPQPVFTHIEAKNTGFIAQWYSVQRAAHYEFYVSTQANFTDTIFRNTQINATLSPKQTVSQLQKERTYFFNVIVQNDCGKRSRSKTRKVKIPSKEESPTNACLPPRPEITDVQVKNYEFTAYWKPIPEIKYYDLYVSKHEDFSDTIYQSKHLYPTQQTVHTVLNLYPKKNYYFNIVVSKKCDNQIEYARSSTRSVTTTCIDDTIIMENLDGEVQFQLVDCEGKVKCMGTLVNDTVFLIGECTDDDPGTLNMGEKPESTLLGPIDLTLTSECTEGQRPVPVKEPGKPKQYECVELPEPYGLDHSCYDLPTDEERLICLANEGVNKVEKIMAKMDEMRNELVSMDYDESSTEAERQSLEKKAKYLVERFEALEDTLDIIREDYEKRLNAITIKGNISIEAKNQGTGFTIGPNPIAYTVRWNKYDDAFEYSGPQLLLEMNVSNFPRKTVRGFANKIKIETTRSFKMAVLDEHGDTIGGVGTLSVSPCIQVRGTIIFNLAALNKFEKMSHVVFWDPGYKSYDPKYWRECKPGNLASKHEKERFEQEILSDIDLDEISNIELHIFLSLTNRLKNVNYSDPFEAYDQAIARMAPVYFEFYADPQLTFSILQGIRSKVAGKFNKYFYHNGIKIYYGYKEFNAETGKKIKEVLE